MSNPLNQIREGMRVIDPSGRDIGKVEWVHLSDEDPDTPGPETAAPSPAVLQERESLVDQIIDAFRTDEVPAPLRELMLRTGFVRIDADGLFAADRYVLPEQIAAVGKDSVTLTVGKDALIRRM